MGFLWTFFLLFRKDLIVARRAYFWTLFQLGLPIAIGLLPYADIIMKLTTNKELKEMITREQEASSVKYFGVPLSTKHSCKDLILNYTIDGDKNSTIDALLEKAKYLKTNRFDTVDDMLRNSTFSWENLPRHSFVFETLTNSTLKYRIITQQLHTMAHDMFPKVFSEEVGGAVYGATLSPIPHLGSPRIDLLNFCVLSALTEQPLYYKGPTIVIAKVSKGTRSLRKSEQQLKMVGLLFFLLPVLLNTARNIASEKESGIKEFLLVMGLSRVTLFLEALAFSCLKTFLCIAALIIQPLNALPEQVFCTCSSTTCMFAQESDWFPTRYGVINQSESRPLFVASCLILGTLFVLIAMVCAAVTTSGSGALALAATIFMILFLHMYWGPDIFFIEFTTNLHHINGFLCYYDIIHGFELFQLRGQPATFGNMFLYSDIFNPGRCIVFLIIDVIALVAMVVVLEHFPVAAVISRLWSPFGKCQLQRMGSCTPVESWHERMEERDSEPVIVVTDVSKVWETTGEVAVNNFSMKAFLGEVTVLLGHNGAGKSTLYSMICGTTPMTSGSIEIFGESITRNLSACRSSMGLCPQCNCIFKYLTVDDHLWFFFELKKGSGLWKEEAEALCTKLSIKHIRKKVASKLSGGEKRKLCIAQAFIAESQLVILDEPTAGLDPKSRRTVEEFVELEKNRRCILLSTHYMDEAETMGDFIYIMYMGRSICCGSPLFLKQKCSINSVEIRS